MEVEGRGHREPSVDVDYGLVLMVLWPRSLRLQCTFTPFETRETCIGCVTIVRVHWWLSLVAYGDLPQCVALIGELIVAHL